MNVLMMGIPFFASEEPVRLHRSKRDHQIRFLMAEGQGGAFAPQSQDVAFNARETVNEIVERVSNDWPVDLLVCWCPELFPPPLDIEQSPVKTVAILSDWNVYFPQLEHNTARYDLVVTDRPGTQQLRLPGCKPLYFGPLYSQRSPIHRKMEIDRDIDILFAGNLNHAVHVERGRCLEKIAALSDRYRVVLCSGLDAHEYARMLNRARIAFNCSIRGEMNLRCFEAPACGALLFVEEYNIEIRDFLRDRQDVILYTPENLMQLLEHYLENPSEADRIALSGQQKIQDLAGENRLDDLIDRIAAEPASPRTFDTLNEETRALANVMQYTSSLMDSQRRLAADLLDDARRRFPNHPELLAASGGTRLDSLDALPEQERKGAIRSALQWFGEACSLAPDAAPFWMNLAYFSRCAGTANAEIQCLEKVLASESSFGGGLLAGSVFDPFYSLWRRSLATGQARVEILWAAAASRLAELRLAQDKPEDALTSATRAIDWLPGIGTSHRLKALAQRQIGSHKTAAATLEDSLHLTAFDAQHRKALVEEWMAIGETDEAKALALESHRIFACCQGGEKEAEMFLKMAGEGY